MIRYVVPISFSTVTGTVIGAGKLSFNYPIYLVSDGGGITSVNGQTGPAVNLAADDIPETASRFWLTSVLKAAYDGAVLWINANGSALIAHLTDTSNPHNTTAAQVGAYPDTNPDGFVDATQAAAAAPVQSVSGTAVSGTATNPVINLQDLSNYQTIPVVVSSNQAAANNTIFHVVATATLTDPSPVEGKGFIVFVRNGTATVGGTAYGTAGTIIHRIFHSGAWANYVFYPDSLSFQTGATYTGSTSIVLTLAEYNAIAVKDANTIYFIV